MPKGRKPRTWESTVQRIQWELPKLTRTNDGRFDLDIHVPMTDIVRRQAHWSYAAGVGEALVWFAEQKGTITPEMIQQQMIAWGLADVWEATQKMKEKVLEVKHG